MKKYYYENVLENQNYVAKPNSVWVADITSFELDENKKVYVFFLLIFSRIKFLFQYLKQKQLQAMTLLKNFKNLSIKDCPFGREGT
jgi:hypothetical protein